MTLMDGSFGTCLWNKAEAKGIEKTPVWMYNITQPEMVEELNCEYFYAGTSLIQTNTFNANFATVSRSDWSVKEIVSAAVKIAKNARSNAGCAACNQISLDIGPLSQYLEPMGDLTEEEARKTFDEVIDAGVDAGVDVIFLETFTDLELMKIGVEVAMKSKLPVFTSFSFEKSGKTMFGNSPEQIAKELSDMGVSAVGINCSFGPEAALPVLTEYKKALGENGPKLIFKPNVDAGITPEMFAKLCKPAMDIADYIGACCGSNPDYIKALATL